MALYLCFQPQKTIFPLKRAFLGESQRIAIFTFWVGNTLKFFDLRATNIYITELIKPFRFSYVLHLSIERAAMKTHLVSLIFKR